MPQTGVDGLALLQRQLLLGEPAAALDAEQVTRRRAALQTPHEHRVDLVLSARARTDQLAATRRAPTHHADTLIGYPDRVQLQGRKRRRDASARSTPADVIEDRDLAEVAMHVHSIDLTTTPFAPLDGQENRWANDYDGFALAAHPGKSQGRRLTRSGSQPVDE